MDNNMSISIAAVGDICLGKGIREKVELHGTNFVFRNIVGELKKSDIMIGNLEVVFPGSRKAAEKWHSDIWAFDDSFSCLTEAGFDVLTLGNNHIMDFGAAGLENTINLLDGHGIRHTGAGMDTRSAGDPVVMDLGSITIGFLCYADDEGQIAGRSRAGVVEATKRNILRDIERLRERVDTIILTLHMGLEFESYPAPNKVSLARLSVSAGADIVLCHHPHVLQGIEVYNGSLICYSLGNFVFQVHDSGYQDNHLPYTAWSVIVKIELSKNGYVSHALVPVVIGEDHCPSTAEGDGGEKIIEHVKHISRPLSDQRCLQRLYCMACWRFARENSWSLRIMFRSKDFSAIFRQLWAMISRAPQRRWIGGYIRYLLSRLTRSSKKGLADDCPDI
jgi:poly-gamma-glutamate synthesis protein (capsule biosynthesis protein)